MKDKKEGNGNIQQQPKENGKSWIETLRIDRRNKYRTMNEVESVGRSFNDEIFVPLSAWDCIDVATITIYNE